MCDKEENCTLESFCEKIKKKLCHAAEVANEFVHNCVTADRIPNERDRRPVLKGVDQYISKHPKNKLKTSTRPKKQPRLTNQGARPTTEGTSPEND